MKKLFSTVIATLLFVALLIPNMTSFAVDDASAEWQDITLTQEELDEIFSNNSMNNVIPHATGLINMYNIAISKSGNTLYIAGKTIGSAEVIKAGFTEVIVQQKLPTTSKWSTYQKYTDLYFDTSSYTLTKSLVVPSGYQYRVICTHYAKKSLLSTQKIDNTSNVLIF